VLWCLTVLFGFSKAASRERQGVQHAAANVSLSQLSLTQVCAVQEYHVEWFFIAMK